MRPADPRVGREAWHALVARLRGAPGDAGAVDAQYRALVTGYSEPGRAYHDLAHVAACLRWLDADRDLARHPDRIEAALWFHDVVYRPRRLGGGASDEERSAERAEQSLRALEVAEADAVAVAELVSATAHFAAGAGHGAAPPEGRDPLGDQDRLSDQDLIRDIDLAILGADPAAFASYQEAIRHEYRHVPGPLYRRGRRRVLESFLDRPTIFRTPRYRERLETAARRNLEQAIAALGPC